LVTLLSALWKSEAVEFEEWPAKLMEATFKIREGTLISRVWQRTFSSNTWTARH